MLSINPDQTCELQLGVEKLTLMVELANYKYKIVRKSNINIYQNFLWMAPLEEFGLTIGSYEFSKREGVITIIANIESVINYHLLVSSALIKKTRGVLKERFNNFNRITSRVDLFKSNQLSTKFEQLDTDYDLLLSRWNINNKDSKLTNKLKIINNISFNEKLVDVIKTYNEIKAILDAININSIIEDSKCIGQEIQKIQSIFNSLINANEIYEATKKEIVARNIIIATVGWIFSTSILEGFKYCNLSPLASYAVCGMCYGILYYEPNDRQFDSKSFVINSLFVSTAYYIANSYCTPLMKNSELSNFLSSCIVNIALYGSISSFNITKELYNLNR